DAAHVVAASCRARARQSPDRLGEEFVMSQWVQNRRDRRQVRSVAITAAAAAAVGTLLAGTASAANNSRWNGGTTTPTQRWLTASNWSPGAVPNAAGDIANFDSLNANRTVNADGAVTVGTINFFATTGSYALSGSAITLDTDTQGAPVF